MRWLSRWRIRLRSLFRRDQLEDELDAELHFHLDQQIRENLAAGMSADEARRDALVELGSVPLVREDARVVWGWAWLDHLRQDVRFALRSVRRNPGFTATAVFTLALGIAAATAVFSLVNAILLRPLPYPDAERLVVVEKRGQTGPGGRWYHEQASFLFVRDQFHSCDAIATWAPHPGLTVGVDGNPELVAGRRISSGYFSVLGIAPRLGRELHDEDEAQTVAEPVTVSQSLWVRLGEPAVGSALSLSGRTYTLVGVIPDHFQPHGTADVWMPLHLDVAERSGANHLLLCRLRTGVSREQAEAELAALAVPLREQFPDVLPSAATLGLTAYQDVVAAETPVAFAALSWSAALLVLLACINTAGLLLARGAQRRREFGMCAALGCSRVRLLARVMTESAVLAVLAAAVGVVLAYFAIRTFLIVSPTDYAMWKVGIDARVLGWAALLVLVTTAVFGLAPTIQALRLDACAALHGDRATAGRATAKARRALVVGEVALTVVLLVSSGLLIRTFVNLRNVNLGFNPNGVLTAQIMLQEARFDGTAAVSSFLERALDAVRRLPGVDGAAIASDLPVLRGLNIGGVIPQEGTEPQPVGFDWRYMTAEYVDLMEIPVVAGRRFDTRDQGGAPAVALVNEAFADLFQRDVLGLRIDPFPFIPARFQDHSRVVVGVVGNVKTRGVGGPPRPTVFVPLRQVPDALLTATGLSPHWVVRSRSNLAALIPVIGDEVRRVDAAHPFSGFRTMNQIVAGALESQRFLTLLINTFAFIALAVATTGLSGVMAYAVALRTREFGIRVAFGADHLAIVQSVLRQGLTLAGAGLVIGVAASLAVTQVLAASLFGVAGTDPLTLAGVTVVLAVVALVAGYGPARRAATVDPMIALRAE